MATWSRYLRLPLVRMATHNTQHLSPLTFAKVQASQSRGNMKSHPPAYQISPDGKQPFHSHAPPPGYSSSIERSPQTSVSTPSHAPTPMQQMHSPFLAPYPAPQLEFHPMFLTCPVCSFTSNTEIEYKSGKCTLLACALGLVCWAFCFDALKDVTHRCKNCGYIFGTRAR